MQGAISNAAGEESGLKELAVFFAFAKRSNALQRRRGGAARVMDGDEEDTYESLAEHSHPPRGMQVKLDRGFEQGVYGITIEYAEAAHQIGFKAARRQAMIYAALLREQLGNMAGHILGVTDDASRAGGPHRKFDLENSFLLFDLITEDGHWHDAATTERFRLALLRVDQLWDQDQARVDTRRRAGRQAAFRQRLDALLDGESYRHVDTVTKERLRAEVTALVFPTRGREL
jgi:hypothetical protein